MTTEETQRVAANDFAVSPRPVVSAETQRDAARVSDYENLGELPRSYGQGVLFAIARDPHTLFAYWEINWPEVFGRNFPPDRKVHLRVFSEDGIEETSAAVEPLAGSHTITVAQARGAYRIELGYHAPADVWNSVATSDLVMTPPDAVADDAAIDIATVPFHLSFQRIADAFRGAKYDGDAIVKILGRLQERADDPAEDAALTDTDREVLRALECSLSDTDALERSLLREAADNFSTRARIEAILGFGATSPM